MISVEFKDQHHSDPTGLRHTNFEFEFEMELENPKHQKSYLHVEIRPYLAAFDAKPSFLYLDRIIGFSILYFPGKTVKNLWNVQISRLRRAFPPAAWTVEM